MCIGLSIVAYGVINHTDLIFDENETLEPIAEGNENETIASNVNSSNNSKNKSKSNLNSDNLYNQISVNDKNQLRQRLKTTSLNIKPKF